MKALIIEDESRAANHLVRELAIEFAPGPESELETDRPLYAVGDSLFIVKPPTQ